MKNEEERKKHNDELLERMKNSNDNLSAFDVMESWYPIRPAIKKDKKEINRVYNKKNKDK